MPSPIRNDDLVDDKEQPVHEEEVGLKHERDVQYDAQESEKSRTGLRRVLRRNPSYEFVRELAVMDETILDEPKVKKASGLSCSCAILTISWRRRSSG